MPPLPATTKVSQNVAVLVYRGLSTDVKPMTNVLGDTQFYETDTGNTYTFNGSSWVLGGGASALTTPVALVNGTITIANTAVTALTKVIPYYSQQNNAFTLAQSGTLTVTVTPGVGYTIISTNLLDTGIVEAALAQETQYGGTIPSNLPPTYGWDFSTATINVTSGTVTSITGIPHDLYTDRGTPAWDWVGPNGSAQLVQFPAGMPRISNTPNLLGLFSGTRYTTALLNERASTNYYVNSLTPVSSQTPTLPTGSYTLWVLGGSGGSATVTAGTATITGGTGSATPGTGTAAGTGNIYGFGAWVNFTVVGQGTVTIATTGSPAGIQVEPLPYPSSFIVTGATTGFRMEEYYNVPTPDAICPTSTVKTSGLVGGGITITATAVSGPSMAVASQVNTGWMMEFSDCTFSNRMQMYGNATTTGGAMSGPAATPVPSVLAAPYTLYNGCVAAPPGAGTAYVAYNGSIAAPISTTGLSNAMFNIAIGGGDFNDGNTYQNQHMDGYVVLVNLFNYTFSQTLCTGYTAVAPAFIADTTVLLPQQTQTPMLSVVGPMVGEFTGSGSFINVCDNGELWMCRAPSATPSGYVSRYDLSCDFGDGGTFNPASGGGSVEAIWGSLVSEWAAETGGSRPSAVSVGSGLNRNLMVGLPMCSDVGTTSTGVAADGSSVALAAAGTYNSVFTTLATSMASNFPNAIMRPGWEFNGNNSYQWAIAKGTTPANYIATFQLQVSLFRAQSQHFVFSWNPNFQAAGGSLSDPKACWPEGSFQGYISNGSGGAGTTLTVTSTTNLVGSILANMYVNGGGATGGTQIVSGSGSTFTVNTSQLVGSAASPVTFYQGYVDEVSFDGYWNPANGNFGGKTGGFYRWFNALGGNRGIAWITAFARQWGKRVGINEWGIYIDTDTYIIQRMYNFVTSPNNNILTSSYWMSNSSTTTNLATQNFPNSFVTPTSPATQNVTLTTGTWECSISGPPGAQVVITQNGAVIAPTTLTITPTPGLSSLSSSNGLAQFTGGAQTFSCTTAGSITLTVSGGATYVFLGKDQFPVSSAFYKNTFGQIVPKWSANNA